MRRSTNATSNSPQQANQQPSRNLFVAGLDRNIDDTGLEDLCKCFGTVVSAKVMVDLHTARSRGFGFVLFEELDAAVKAKAGLSGLGRIVVEYSTVHTTDHLVGKSDAIFVRNIPQGTTDHAVCAHFDKVIGGVTAVEILKDTAPGATGAFIVARVTFSSTDSAQLAERKTQCAANAFAVPGGPQLPPLLAKIAEPPSERAKRIRTVRTQHQQQRQQQQHQHQQQPPQYAAPPPPPQQQVQSPPPGMVPLGSPLGSPPPQQQPQQVFMQAPPQQHQQPQQHYQVVMSADGTQQFLVPVQPQHQQPMLVHAAGNGGQQHPQAVYMMPPQQHGGANNSNQQHQQAYMVPAAPPAALQPIVYQHPDGPRFVNGDGFTTPPQHHNAGAATGGESSGVRSPFLPLSGSSSVHGGASPSVPLSPKLEGGAPAPLLAA
jgi:RNA recognition motif-containing protein